MKPGLQRVAKRRRNPFTGGWVKAHYWIRKTVPGVAHNPRKKPPPPGDEEYPKYFTDPMLTWFARERAYENNWNSRTGQPDGYPPRFPIPREYCAWEASYPGYTPVEYEAPELSTEAWAEKTEPEVRPRNPVGRTGITGRGKLGKWGPNFAADNIITRENPETGEVEVLVLIRKDDKQQTRWAFPGGMVDEGEVASAAATRELREEVGITVDMETGEEMFKGYVDDPRNTDNAWMTTTAMWKHLPVEETRSMKVVLAEKEVTKWAWKPIGRELIGNMYASHGAILSEVYDVLQSQGKTS